MSQHLDALALANQVRLARCVDRGRLAAGELTFAAALELPHWQSAMVADLLSAQHYWGSRRVAQALATAGCSPTRRVRDLTARQRDALLLAVDALHINRVARRAS